MAHLNGSTLQWVGHATVYIRTAQGTNVLIDPWLESNPACPKDWKAPEKLDLVLCTHGHMDHIGDALSVWKKYKPTFVGMNELAGWLEGKGIEKTVGMNIGGTYTFQDLAITMVEARHSSGILDNGQYIYGGEPAGFILQAQGEPVLYHAGDTALFSDMQLIQELYAPEIAMLPIGDHYTMGPAAAARAAEFLGCRKIIPIHFATFPALTGRPEELRQRLQGKSTEVLELKPGQTID